MKKHKWAVIAGAIAAGIVLLVALSFGVHEIAAQEPTPTPVPGQPSPQGGGRRGGRWGGMMRGAARWGWQARGQADIIAAALGMSTDDMVVALRDGKSVAQLAQEKGVALDTVVEALRAPRQEALAQAVANGRLTQAEADAKLAQMEEQITARLQEPGMWKGPAEAVRRAERKGWQARGQVDTVAQTLGMSTEDLVTALRDGKSVAHLAQEKGVALDQVVEALLSPQREALAQAVANGKLTQAEADAKLAQMQERITERLQQPGLFGGRGGRWGGQCPCPCPAEPGEGSAD